MNAKHWLECYLMLPGLHETQEVTDAAKNAGISVQDLKKAKTRLKVVTTNNWSKTHPTSQWFWALPGDDR